MVNIIDFDNIFSTAEFLQLNIYTVWVLLWNSFLNIFLWLSLSMFSATFSFFYEAHVFNIFNVSIFECILKSAFLKYKIYFYFWKNGKLCLIIRPKTIFRKTEFLNTIDKFCCSILVFFFTVKFHFGFRKKLFNVHCEKKPIILRWLKFIRNTLQERWKIPFFFFDLNYIHKYYLF